MFGKNDVSDKELSKTVNSRLSRTGTGSRVTAVVSRGVVTLSGNLQYAGQRIPIKNAASRIAGVRQVIDLMQFVQKKATAVLHKPYIKPDEPAKQAEATPPSDTIADSVSELADI